MAVQGEHHLRYGWRRFWIGLHDAGGVAVRGLFNPDLHALSISPEVPQARTLQQMDDVCFLLLRGESGAGKTVALCQEAERLRASGAGVVAIDLADGLTDAAEILDEKGNQQNLTLLLDGLDVALIHDRTLDSRLRGALSRLPPQGGARIRLALRTGFASEQITQLLVSRFGDTFEHLTLAPLRPEDVMASAAAEGIDPQAFLDAVDALRLTPLTARPPTLRMLLRLWTKNGALPKHRVDVYREGCEALLRETSSHRRNARGGDDPEFVGHLQLPERFGVARYLAAMLAFGNQDNIDLTPEPSGSGLHLDDVTGAIEPSGGSTVKLTSQNIREVVGTALFRPVGSRGFGLAHSSLMSFLAASFVEAHGLAPRQMSPLLSAPDGRVGANRIELASLLGAIAPNYFSELVEKDPQVLLRSGIPAGTPEARLELARSLLDASAKDKLDLKELDATRDLVLLAAAGLEDLLRPIIADASQPQAQRAFAVRMATDTRCIPVAACAALAQDPGEQLELRLAAVAALNEKIDGAEDIILALSAKDEPIDALRVAALSVAMRHLLAPADVIRRLKPSGRLSRQDILCLRLLREIDSVAIPDALDAIGAIAASGSLGGKSDTHLTIAQSLAQQAFENLGDSRAREALTRFIATIPAQEPWLRWSFPLQKRGLPCVATQGLRRALVSGVVVQAQQPSLAARTLLEACFLLRREDLPWIVNETLQALDGPHAAIWSTLAFEVAAECGSPPYAVLQSAGATMPEIYRMAHMAFVLSSDFERWTPPLQWDPASEAFVDDEEAEEPGAGRDEHVEPILKSAQDWKLRTVQAAAGGRANAPPVGPATLASLAQEADRRLVLDDKDLLRVVLESLGRLQERLKGRDPLVRALWDEGNPTRPKEENFLSDFIVDHLRQDMVLRGVVADREVQVRQRLVDTPGERLDIRVQAFTSGGSTFGRQQVASLTIEVKGCWNKDLYTSMQTQLADRYLSTTRDTVGLYLVGWYVCGAWKSPKIANLAPAQGVTLASLRTTLEGQAAGLSSTARLVQAMVLDASLS